MRVSNIEIQPDCPPGWFRKTSVTLLAPDGQANVIASSEPLDATIDNERYAAVQLDLLQREFPHFAEHASGRLDLGGIGAIWRQFSWTPPDGVSITQLQLYAVTNGRGHTATATTPTASWNRFEELFHDTFRSMIVAVDENST